MRDQLSITNSRRLLCKLISIDKNTSSTKLKWLHQSDSFHSIGQLYKLTIDLVQFIFLLSLFVMVYRPMLSYTRRNFDTVSKMNLNDDRKSGLGFLFKMFPSNRDEFILYSSSQ